MHDKLLPIVAGCKAVVTGPANRPRIAHVLGTEVDVIRRCTDYGASWIIDSPLICKLKDKGLTISWTERYLMRIDGGAPESEVEEQELKCKT